MYTRNVFPAIQEALSDTPIVFLVGARQTGKTTLARTFTDFSYMTLDSFSVSSAAALDPEGFISGIDKPAVIDEIQKVPSLLPAIKRCVDEDRRAGRFLLTGSANVLTLPKVSESLAGRMEVITLWPLSQGELGNVRETFLDKAFLDTPTSKPSSGFNPIPAIVAGGFPEVLTRKNPERRAAWFESYLTAILERDIRDLSGIERLNEMPNLLAVLASRSAQLLNLSDIASSVAMPLMTVKRYIALLEAAFLVVQVPAWSSNLGKRLIKSPKVFTVDTGLACNLLGINEARLTADSTLAGHFLENFVGMELMKQIAWNQKRPRLYHFRTVTGLEVDFVVELPDGRIVGIEVKSRVSVGSGDFRGLKALEETTGPQFVQGILLYAGLETIPFGQKLKAVPLSQLFA